VADDRCAIGAAIGQASRLANLASSASMRVAGLAWSIRGGPEAFNWYDGLGVGVPVLAQVIAARPSITAAELYAFAVATDDRAARWEALPPPQRVAIEVFRASFALLYAELMAQDAPRAPVVVAAPPPPKARLAVVPPSAIDDEVARLEDRWRDDGRPRGRRGQA
jgi:hypothetical protein